MSELRKHVEKGCRKRKKKLVDSVAVPKRKKMRQTNITITDRSDDKR